MAVVDSGKHALRSTSGRATQIVTIMKTVCRASCLLIPLLLAGCQSDGNISILGYTTKPPYDPDIHTVYVPIALNVSYLKTVEFELTQAVLRELSQRKGAPRVTSDRAHADTELVMKIVTPTKSTININQNGEIREAETKLSIEVTWRDLRPGHTGDILSNKKRFDPNQLPLPGEAPETAPKAIPLIITPAATYAPEVGGSNVSAQALSARRAAMQIVNMMEVWR